MTANGRTGRPFNDGSSAETLRPPSVCCVSDRIVVGFQDDEGLDLVAGDEPANLAAPRAGIGPEVTRPLERTACDDDAATGLAVSSAARRVLRPSTGSGDASVEHVGRSFEICGHDLLLSLQERLHRLLEREHGVFGGRTEARELDARSLIEVVPARRLKRR